MRTVLVSTYDMGRQPFGLASPAAWLREAGVDVVCQDISRERLDEGRIREADLVGFFLPMHTATRLAIPVIDRVRAINPTARLCAYGLYAPLNDSLLREHGIDLVLGGEFEESLRDLAVSGRAPAASASGSVPRLQFRQPDRSGLLPLARYATLQAGPERLTVGYTEASRGCKHRCRHCPIVPVYDGRFRIVPVPTVMADVRAQVESGARHVTFGDPDFLNGIGHARAVLEAFHREFKGITFDVTIKVEHLLRHAEVLPLLRESGCRFVTSAVESIDDAVLEKLDKGHTRADFERVVASFDRHGLVLNPTFVAFTPWTTLRGYAELLETIARLGLVDRVAPIQLAIRLLVTRGSRLLDLDDIRALVDEFDARSLTFPWRHSDPAVDALQQRISAIVGSRISAARADTFARIVRAVEDAGGFAIELGAPRPRTEVPYLDEPWYC